MNYTKAKKEWEAKQQEVKEDSDNLQYFGEMIDLGVELI